MVNKNHMYHLVEVSPWPLMSSLMSLSFLLSLLYWFNSNNNNMNIMMILLILVMIQWWRDVIRESTFQGNHTLNVMMGLKWGMILFILSEILLFTSFFWSFFHSSLSSSIELGMIWPPKGIQVFNMIQVPLLNTLILISSGITVTWAHWSMMENNYKETNISLMLTVFLGIYFTLLQLYEYKMSLFTISDSIYGSMFFIMTGFHGFHVIIGTLFLLICLMRQKLNHFSMNHNFGFEASAWYWHFVDIVWIFLYISVYWWGS